ncbi:MAG: MCE family protein, partial [Frankiales bacterium]|nr:MCE family protein [Frankiales bacterium]
NRLIRLAADSLPSLQVYDRYSPEFPCLAAGLTIQEKMARDTFGGLQPGLHITLEVVADQGGYQPGDEPRYGEDRGPTCFGLPPNAPVRPFPSTYEPVDGYCDREEAATPGVSASCRDGRGQGSGPFEPARALASVRADRRAVGAAVGPVLGVPADEIPDLALLLFGPVARGTIVGLSR